MSLSVRLSVCESVRPSVSLSVRPSVSLSVRPSASLSACEFVRLSVSSSVCPPVCPPIQDMLVVPALPIITLALIAPSARSKSLPSESYVWRETVTQIFSQEQQQKQLPRSGEFSACLAAHTIHTFAVVETAQSCGRTFRESIESTILSADSIFIPQDVCSARGPFHTVYLTEESGYSASANVQQCQTSHS